MQPFTTLTALAVPLDAANIDTDQIIPARFLKFPRSDGYDRFLFHDLRFDASGKSRPDFFLNRKRPHEVGIIVANENFGCGSSREGAVYALYDSGIRCVIAPSFGDIFYNNSIKNGLLPLRLPSDTVTGLRRALAPEGAVMTVNLERQMIVAPDRTEIRFEIDPYGKKALLKGLDEIRLTLEYRNEIEAFGRDRLAAEPWLRCG